MLGDRKIRFCHAGVFKWSQKLLSLREKFHISFNKTNLTNWYYKKMRVSNNHHQWLSIYNNIFFKEFFSLSSLIYFYVLTSLKFKAIYCAKMLSKCHKALRRDFFTHEENLFCSHLISHESLFLSFSQHFYCLAFFFSFWCSSSWKSWLLDNFPYCCFFLGSRNFYITGLCDFFFLNYLILI